MLQQTLRTMLVLLLLVAVTLGVGAKTCRVAVIPQHVLSPSSDTEVLSEADSLIIYACPAFSGGTISYTTEADLNETLQQIEAYLAEQSLEGEYTLWPIDADSKQKVGHSITTSSICLKQAEGSEAERLVKGDLGYLFRDFLFIVAAIALAIAAFYLFTSRKLGFLGKVLGCVAGLIAVYLGIVGVLAIAMLALKYILIIIGCVLVLCFVVGVFMNLNASSKREAKAKKEQHGWRSDGGVVYMSKEAAEKNSSDKNNVRMV